MTQSQVASTEPGKTRRNVRKGTLPVRPLLISRRDALCHGSFARRAKATRHYDCCAWITPCQRAMFQRTTAWLLFGLFHSPLRPYPSARQANPASFRCTPIPRLFEPGSTTDRKARAKRSGTARATHTLTAKAAIVHRPDGSTRASSQLRMRAFAPSTSSTPYAKPRRTSSSGRKPSYFSNRGTSPG